MLSRFGPRHCSLYMRSVSSAVLDTQFDTSDQPTEFNASLSEQSPPSTSIQPPPKPLPLTKSSLNYPWLMSYSPSRVPPPSLWSSIKSKHILKAAIARAHSHLQEPAYQFPEDFYEDAQVNVRRLFDVLSSDIESVSHIMTKSLASHLITAHNALIVRGARVEYTPRSTTYTNATNPLSIRLKSINYTYGPYPAPPTHSPQRFYDLITLMLPRDPLTGLEQEFESYDHQIGLLNQAMSHGCYMRIDTIIDVDVRITVWDGDKEIVKDVRESVCVEFVSPHFRGADEIFEMREDGGWKLGFEWRISDLDYLCKVERMRDEEREKVEGRRTEEMLKLGFGSDGKSAGLQKIQ